MNSYASNTALWTVITDHTVQHWPLNIFNIHHKPHNIALATQHFQHHRPHNVTLATQHFQHHRPHNVTLATQHFQHHSPHNVTLATQHSEHLSQTTQCNTGHSTLWTPITDHSSGQEVQIKAAPDRRGSSILFDRHHAGHVLGFAKSFQHKVSIHQAMNAALHGTRCVCDKARADALCSYHNTPATVHSGYTEGKIKITLVIWVA